MCCGHAFGEVDYGLIGGDAMKVVTVERFLIGDHLLGIERFVEVVIDAANGF